MTTRRLLPVGVLIALAVTLVFPVQANDAVRRLAKMCGRVASDAPAHHGAPARLTVGQTTGPYAVSLWATSDTGAGRLYVVVPSRAGVLPPREVRIELRTASDTTLARVVRAYPEPVLDGARFVADIALPRVTTWEARVLLDGASGPGAVRTTFASGAPASAGLAGLALASLPFVLVAGLWGPLRLVRRPQVTTRPASTPSP
jgi:hypothetical protein